jgi:hypothetical protein
MARKTPGTYVLRDTGTSVVFWIMVALGAVLVGDPLLRGDLPLVGRTAPIVGLVLWVLGMVLFHPHIRYDDERIVVTNIGRVHEIPWGRVLAVRQNLSLSLGLDDGRRISATGVTAPRDRGLLLGSLTRGRMGAGSTDFHRYADALRPLHAEAASTDNATLSRWDVRPLALGAVLLVVAAIDVGFILS